MPIDVDVLIVGAGPTGLMLANQLGRRGIRATIIDRHSGPAQQTRAMAVHARTLEIFTHLGIADRAVSLGKIGYGSNIWSQGRLRARIPLGEIGQGVSPFPYVLMLGQDDTERILGDTLKQWGTTIRWNTELIALQQASTHVTATIKAADGRTQTIVAKYVAGCDGGRSSVREMNGIGFPGEPYEHVFFVADTEATGQMVPDELNVYMFRDGFTLFFPMRGPDAWRVIGILPEHLNGREHVTFDDVIPSLQHESGASLTFKTCKWFSTYRIHHRCTERFRDRRCFLAGDAAHVHSPMGGQGMNTGLQDAYNLAWKLALVLTGRADESLLDTYEAERMPVAHQLLETTDRAFRLLVTDKWYGGIFRTRIVANLSAIMTKRERVKKIIFRTLSQTGIAYPKSPLSQNLEGLPKGAPRAGDRFPWLHLKFSENGAREDVFQKLDDTRFNLLVIGQPAPSAERLGLDALLTVHAIPSGSENAAELARVSIDGPAYYLVRPDGHVGLAGTRFDERTLRQWLDRYRFRLDRAGRSDDSVEAKLPHANVQLMAR